MNYLFDIPNLLNRPGIMVGNMIYTNGEDLAEIIIC